MISKENNQNNDVEVLNINEEENLYEKRKVIINSEKISKSISFAKNSLNQNIIDCLFDSIKEMDKISDYNIEYSKINGLSLEARQKLDKIRPLTIGQASRVSGVNPADISILILNINLFGDLNEFDFLEKIIENQNGIASILLVPR